MNATKQELLRRYRVQLFTATWLSYAGFYFARKVYAVLKHPLKDQFGLDDVQIAWPWTIYLITYMLGQFLAAWLGRRMESRRVLAWGMCVAAACNIVLGWLVDSHLASVFLWMCVTMGIHGLAQATGWPHNVALFANWTRRSERGTLFGIWGTCYQIGGDRRQGPRRIPARLAGNGLVVLRLEHRAARIHAVLRHLRARAAAVGRPVARGRCGARRRPQPAR